MADIEDKIDMMLSEDGDKFASSFGMPRIAPWISKQYNKGHRSSDDFKIIVNWVINNNPNLDGFDFMNALKKAKAYLENSRKTNFDPYMELQSNNEIIDFENGKRWISIGPEDCNAICHRLQYDCHHELMSAYNGSGSCYALQDPQDNTLCVFVDSDGDQYGKIIGQFGKKPKGCQKEIKSLCINRGLNLVPDAYTNTELVRALSTKEIDIDNLPDIYSVMRRLNARDVINCNVLNHSHYCTIKTIYDLYCKTKHACLLTYALCHMITHGLTNHNAYGILKAAAEKDPAVIDKINAISGNDTKPYITAMDDAQQEIMKL